ncbi:MAG: T9SS type A sorting domain-containing protein [Ignavibacteriales bacterium]|nr:T9SS type A sorting domain-containing protein [Ignavibacteriales bacterium]
MKSVVPYLGLFFAITEARAQYTNVRVSSPQNTYAQEVTIAINPTNSQNLIAACNPSGTSDSQFYSTDGGQSWVLNGWLWGNYGDPCVLFDVNGRAYYAHITSMAGGYFLDRMTVHRSSNGGMTWYDSLTTPVNSPKNQDKGWLACDVTSSAYRNNVYMAWTEFDKYGSKSALDSSRILFSRIVNGTDLLTVPIKVSDESGNCVDSDSTLEGAIPAVGPNGEAYLAWAGPKGIMFDRSLDGGITFGSDIFVTSMPGGWDYDVPGIYRCNGLPMTVCDVSNSPYRGTVYVLWGDQRNGVDNTDVFIVKSNDNGLSWTLPQRVNTDGGTAQQFFPSIAIDESNGFLYVVFYDRRNYSPSDSTTDVYLAKSTDGGETWNDFKISQVPFVPKSSIFFGDYIHIAVINGMIRPIWMRLDTTKLSVWTALIDDFSSAVENKSMSRPQAFRVAQNYPNPFNGSTKIEFELDKNGLVSLRVFDVLGRRIATLVNAELTAGRHAAIFYADDLPSGVYFYEVHAGTYGTAKKMMITK